ncbi:MAG TPA: alkaline phosphatase family protein, partial [Holophagaceae bacterium]|nr:alkaline phosphatase family protein [Holophagaceae bacterium]
MRKHTSLALALAVGTITLGAAQGREGAVQGRHSEIRHVLLLSVDGLHALDLANYVRIHPASAMARLSGHGITYTNASCPRPSDSFPGMLALVTGGSPVSHGVFYDVAYSRDLQAPGSHPGDPIGTAVTYDESLDFDMNALDGGGGINPANLPINPVTHKAVWPHEFMRANTIFEVAKRSGLRTAWSDKHFAYEILQGPSGKGIDDLFTPEIGPSSGTTSSLPATEAYDDIKVQAILNEINGLDHAGKTHAGTPAIFGMNFQAVSVGQKLAADGYTDGDGTPSAGLENALEHTDRSLGKMLDAIEDQGLGDRTLIILTAKHGQSPIDPAQVQKIDDALITNTVNGVAPNLLAGMSDDDGALLWLADQSKTAQVVAALRANRAALAIEEIYAGESLKLRFNNPEKDAHVPDIMIQPAHGVIYTTSHKKNAEHGGFGEDDTHVALLVSHPDLEPRVV